MRLRSNEPKRIVILKVIVILIMGLVLFKVVYQGCNQLAGMTMTSTKQTNEEIYLIEIDGHKYVRGINHGAWHYKEDPPQHTASCWCLQSKETKESHE